MFAGFAFTSKSLDDVFRCLKENLRTYPGRRLCHASEKKVFPISILDYSKMSLRAKVAVTYFAQIVTGTIFILFRRYGGGIIVTSYFGSTEKQKGKIVLNRTR